MQVILDPKFFNYVIMILYIINSIRWWYHGHYADMFYWICAFGITATVTWGYSHGA